MFISLHDEDINNFPKNRIFIDIHQEFMKNGWRLRYNTMTNLIYYNPQNPSDEFKINMSERIVYVTVPITPGNYEYTTKFTSLYLSSEYLSFHLKNYHDKLTL